MASYLWSTGETTQAIQFAIDSTTEITLTVTNANGETFTTCTPLQVRVNSFHLVQEAGSDTVDCGELVTLRLLPVAHWFPATNTWYRNGGWYSENQFVLSSYGTPPGSSSVWVLGNVDPIGCVTDSDTLTYFVRDPIPPVLSFDGNSIRMSYDCLTTFWYRDGIQLSGNDSSIVITQNGCYWADCISCLGIRTDTLCIDDMGLGEEDPWPAIFVFPNPATGEIQLKTDGSAIISAVTIVSTTGQVVLRSNAMLIDVTMLQQGTYFIIAETTAGRRYEKLIRAGSD
jgi:hypothetical protein